MVKVRSLEHISAERRFQGALPQLDDFVQNSQVWVQSRMVPEISQKETETTRKTKKYLLAEVNMSTKQSLRYLNSEERHKTTTRKETSRFPLVFSTKTPSSFWFRYHMACHTALQFNQRTPWC